MTPWIVAHQSRLPVGFPGSKYWSGLPFPSLGYLPDPGIEPRSPARQIDSLPMELPKKTSKKLQKMIKPLIIKYQQLKEMLIKLL